jgi:hypothetical protein
MWLTFGNKTRVHPVAGGVTVDRHCDRCQAVRRFVECEVADRISVFFVSVVDMKSRRLVCQECGEDQELPTAAAAPAPAPAARPPARAKASDAHLERMLADLKKKMDR